MESKGNLSPVQQHLLDGLLFLPNLQKEELIFIMLKMKDSPKMMWEMMHWIADNRDRLNTLTREEIMGAAMQIWSKEEDPQEQSNH